MALSNAQLLMFDNLIYTDYVSDGMSVGEIITAIENDGFNVSSCEMTSSEWKELVSMIKEEHSLLNYKVTNYVDDDKTGMRAACFVNDESNPRCINYLNDTAYEFEEAERSISSQI